MTGDPAFEVVDRLAAFAVSTSFDDLPAAVVDRERWHLLDTLGCALYGATTPWVGALRDGLAAAGEPADGDGATLWGAGGRLPPARAALVNGTATHAMDYDDHCQDAGLHAGSATVPCALAAAEAADGPVAGDAILAAVAVGVEVGVRAGLAIGFESVRRGWHIAGWTGAVAGAATTAALLDLDADRAAHALAVGATQGSGLLGAQYGASVKRVHMGRAAEAGYLGAALAAAGVTGDRGALADRYGSAPRALSGPGGGDPAAALDGLGERWRLLDVLSLKPFPSVGMIHAAVDAARAAMADAGVAPADVESVTVHATEATKEHVGWAYEPTGVMAAQASLQYALAALLVDGDLTVESYGEAAIRRPAVLDRVADVEVAVDPAIDEDAFGARVEVVPRDGPAVERAVETPRGYPENPMGEADLRAKFRRQAGAALDDDRVDDVEALALGVDEAGNVRELAALLAG